MMKSMYAKLLALCLALCLMAPAISLFPSASAANATVEHAYALNELGLFQGTDSGFELDKRPTRIEGMTMFVRLLGGDREATQNAYTHPFGDVPSWGDPYVGYAWKHSLTKGTSADTFGSTAYITLEEYLTFVLRALGYDDAKGDFAWNTSVDKAVSIGLLTRAQADEFLDETTTRGTMADISYAALTQTFKDGKQTLAEKLVADGAFTRELAIQKGVWTGEVPAVTPTPSATPSATPTPTPTPKPSATPTPTPTPTPSAKPEPTPEPEPEKTGILVQDYAAYDKKGFNSYLRDDGKFFEMGGEKYSNGFTLDEYNHYGACASFNLNGAHATLDFNCGNLDESDRYASTVQVYKNGKYDSEFTISSMELPKHMTLDVSGVQELKFLLVKGSMTTLGFADMLLDATDADLEVPAPTPGTAGNLLELCPPYYSDGTSVYRPSQGKSFQMRGTSYSDGMTMYTYGKDDAQVLFNLGGRYQSLTMEYGPVDGTSEWSQRDRTLQIFLENELVQEIPLSFESMVQTVTIPLNGAHALRLQIKAIGAGTPEYGFANLQLS